MDTNDTTCGVAPKVWRRLRAKTSDFFQAFFNLPFFFSKFSARLSCRGAAGAIVWSWPKRVDEIVGRGGGIKMGARVLIRTRSIAIDGQMNDA